MQDQAASTLIGGGSLTTIKANVFRFTQSLDDSSMIFWRPYNLNEGEFLISIAARREDQVREILQTWEIITLKNFTDFKTHENIGNIIW